MDLSRANFDFLGKRKIALIGSSVLLIASLFSLAASGLKLGIDFTGGTLLEVGYKQAVSLSETRENLKNGGFGDAVVQHFGSSKEILIRIPLKEGVSSAYLSNRHAT